MKQKLIALLKTSFASKGFNAKELEALADLVIRQHTLTDESTDEDLSTAVTAAKPTADFVQSVASRQVSDVKKPAKVEEPAKKEDSAEPATPTDMPEWAKGLLTSVGALTQGLAAIQTEKVGNTRREQYAKTLEGTSEAYQKAALKNFDRMNFTDDEDFSTYLSEATEDAKVFVQEESNTNLGLDRPVGSFVKTDPKGEKEVSPAMKELIAERTAKAENKTA